MDCREVQKVLEAFVDDELEAQASYEVDRHLGLCARCRAEADGLRALDARLYEACRRNAKAAGAACEALRARVFGRIDREIASEARRRRLARGLRRAGALVAVFALAAALAIGLFPGPAAADFVAHHVVCCRKLRGDVVCEEVALRALCEAQGGAHARILCLGECGFGPPRALICTIDGAQYMHLVYERKGLEPISVFLRRSGIAERLRGERSERRGDYEVVRVICPAGTEYVAVVSVAEAERVRGLIARQVGR
jgi:hypothetical protein